MSEPRVVVLGLGNLVLRDEGVGVHVVHRLAEMELPAGVEVLDGGTTPLEALSRVEDVRRLIVVDAMEAEGPPGAVHALTPSDLASRTSKLSLHEANLVEALATWEYWGLSLDKVVLLGVVPEAVEWGTELSSALSQKRFASVVLLPFILELPRRQRIFIGPLLNQENLR